MTNITGIQEILSDLEKRVNDKILEQNNFELLKKLVENADSLDEAIKIAELGTTYKRTGFHFDKRIEKQSNTISCFRKNNELSFETSPDAITHKLIVGDNYPALLNLLVEYKGKIDVIYIDPPYGKDSLGEFADTNYDNAITRDNLLSMLYPRLYVAKWLLSDNGVIFCSIDDRNQAYVKCLFDEVFDEISFESCFTWQKTDPKVDRNTNAKQINRSKNIHENIICYCKNRNTTRFNEIHKFADWADREKNNPDNDKRGAWQSGIISYQEGHKNEDRNSSYYYTIISPSGREITRHFFVEESEMKKLLADNRIYFPKGGDGVPRLKTFALEEQSYKFETIIRGLGTSCKIKYGNH